MESVTDLGWAVAREVVAIAGHVTRALARLPVRAVRRVWHGRG
jgi:hypothetical protein